MGQLLTWDNSTFSISKAHISRAITARVFDHTAYCQGRFISQNYKVRISLTELCARCRYKFFQPRFRTQNVLLLRQFFTFNWWLRIVIIPGA